MITIIQSTIGTVFGFVILFAIVSIIAYFYEKEIGKCDDILEEIFDLIEQVEGEEKRKIMLDYVEKVCFTGNSDRLAGVRDRLQAVLAEQKEGKK